MRLTNKLNFNLTIKRFKMMGTSRSIVRLIPIILAVTSVTSLLTLASFLDVFDGHPKEIYTNDLTLTALNENRGARGFYWITWLDSDGNPYSGEHCWLYRINDEVARKEFYEDGKQTLVEIFNEDGSQFVSYKSEFTTDENGVRYLKHIQKFDSSEQFLAFDAKWDQNIHTVREYFENGQLRYEFSFNTEKNKYEGFAFLYDEQGNLLKQERYENGILIETIK